MKEREKSQPAPPLPERILGEAACLALEYGIRPIIRGEEHFAQTTKHLENGSVIFYFNHCSAIDPGILANILKANTGTEIKNWVVPGSYRHLDPERGDFGPIDRWAVRGFAYKYRDSFELCPVVQFYDENSYPRKLVTKTNVKFAQRARKVLQTPGGVLFIAPEGTRSKTHKLLKAQRGVGWFLKQGENIAAQPMALIGSGLPQAVLRKPVVVIGPLYTSKEVLEFAKKRVLKSKMP